MNTTTKILLACWCFPTLLLAQKIQNKPVWQFDLQFDFRKADLRAEYLPKLDSLVVAMQDSTFLVNLKAHTDAIGDAKANIELSEKRAESVKTYLVRKNVLASRLYTEGVGETEPIEGNETDIGRQHNRRVVVTVLRRLAQVSGIITDNDGKPVANMKTVLSSKYVKDSVFTDANGAYSLTARLNLAAKIIVVPNPSDNCPLYDGQIFTVNNWTMTQNVQLKCKIKPAPIVTSTVSVVKAKKAPQQVRISGVVTNDSGQIVKNARLVFSNDQGRDTVFTDDKGYYSVFNLMFPDIKVSISASKHLPFYKGFVADLPTKKMDFKIQTIGIGKKAALQNINFYYGTYTVMEESQPSLADLVQFMHQNPKYHVEVRGHITASNPEQEPIGNIDRDLSYNRAKAIYQYLIDNGIQAERMIYKGYSNHEMLFPYPETEEEHRANRRVEIKIISE